VIDLTNWTTWLAVWAFLFVLFNLSAPTTLHRDYCALMNLKRVRDAHGLSPVASVLAGYLLLRGYLVDFYVNMVHMTILMREWPQEWTVTDRVSRLQVDGNARQRRIAQWFCADGLHLDHLDPSGCHCKQPD
jgi:hypothetical protein